MTLVPIEPEGWKRGRGYSHAIRAADRLMVAGVLPWDPTSQRLPDADFAGQWALALENLKQVLAAGGATPAGVGALRIYVTDLDAYRSAGGALADGWNRVFGTHFPAITLVEVSRLVLDGALIEIEAEAMVEAAG